jgi:AraC-like DNA-binding protein
MGEEEDRYRQFMAERAQPPPLTSGDTLQWDGRGAVSQGVELTPGSEPVAYPVYRSTGSSLQQDAGGLLHAPTRPLGLLPASSAPAIDWVRAAVALTFYLEPDLLLAPSHDVIPGVTGTLLWVHGQGDGESITFRGAHPALLIQTASASSQGTYVELVPHVPLDDPLLDHSALVLQAAVVAEDVAGRLYAEALANALAAHFLSRYVAGRQPERVFSGGLTPSKLAHMIAYILAHLEHTLSLADLAAVAQMSPAHFARLFKQATGRTPHQYVILCRIECAKQLLTETALSLSEIGSRVGYVDQSHFTALFRQHVGTTPKIYRDATSGT